MGVLSEIKSRHESALRRLLGPRVLEALESPDVVEVMLNPDGTLWIDSRREGLSRIDDAEAPDRAEPLLRQVAGLTGQSVSREAPILEAELPLDGARFTGVLPPVVPRPSYAIRKRAVRIYPLDDRLPCCSWPWHEPLPLAWGMAPGTLRVVSGGQAARRPAAASKPLVAPGTGRGFVHPHRGIPGREGDSRARS